MIGTLALYAAWVTAAWASSASTGEMPTRTAPDIVVPPVAAAPMVAPWPPAVEIDETDGRLHLQRSGATWSTADEWHDRAAQLRRQVLVGLDLDPLPPETGAAPIHGPARELDGYSVEHVSFTTFAGADEAAPVRVSGNLYRPLDLAPPYAAVLSPHGHFQARDGDPGGRFRRDMQIRCATLARMGAVVFAWDMVGWGEDEAREHHDPVASRLQTLNSVRTVDFVARLPEVDARRIGVTGASGGGTQSFLLASVDERIACCVPVVMVSAHFFGGCPCESGLPIHDALGVRTTNAELAATVAPRALLLVSCGEDWTRNTPSVEFPYVRRVYETLDAAGQVANAHFPDEGHDYGATKRAPMYRFMARHLALDLARVTRLDGTIDEDDIEILPRAALLGAPRNDPDSGH